MKRLVMIVVGGVVSIGAIAGLVSYPRQAVTEEISTYHVCRVCGGYRVTRKTIVDGVGGRTSVENLPSKAFLDLLGDSHEHEWAFEYSNSKSRNTRAHADGFPGFTGRMPNDFTAQYNHNPAFREIVQARIRAGDLSLELVREIVLLEDLLGDSAAAARAREIPGALLKYR